MRVATSYTDSEGVVHITDYDSGLTPGEVEYLVRRSEEFEQSFLVLVVRVDEYEYKLIGDEDIREVLQIYTESVVGSKQDQGVSGRGLP